MTCYTTEERKNLKAKWIARMEDWKNSGLSGSAWCRRENIVDHQFVYWKQRLSSESKPKLDAHSFVELDDHSDASGIEIVFNGIAIRLSKDFHSPTLHRCITALKGVKC